MYKGFGGGNMQSLMAQAQRMQKQMQEKMEKAEEELNNAELTGSASGMVTVVVDGHKNVKSISIKPEAVDPDDIEMLEDLLMASFNEAFAKADELSKSLKGDGLGGLF